MSFTFDLVTTIRSRSKNTKAHPAGGIIILAVITFSFLIVGCSRAQTPPGQAGPQFTIQRLAPSVFMGGADPLPEITVDQVQDFPLNFLATTGQDGEAVIKGELEGASCSIFIFFDTRLERSACNKAASEGNTTCLEEGSAVFENCHNHLVQTASGEVKLLGTWASVTYLPDQKLTLLAVTEGETSVQPVLDETTGSTGSPVSVGAGEYYYSAPDQDMNPVPGITPRQPVPLSELDRVLAQYPQASDWIRLAMDRSRAYGVNPAQFAPPPTVTPLPTVQALPTIRQRPTVLPLNLLMIPRPVRANSPLVDGLCLEDIYGLGYLYRFRLSGDVAASGYLIQDDDWLYVCGTNTAGSPAAGTLALFLDPQGNGNLYPFADQGDYQLKLDVSRGRVEILAGNGDGGYVATDAHSRDWLSPVALLEDKTQIQFEYAINIDGFGIGNCGQPFGLALAYSDFPNNKNVYGWPDGFTANRPASWQPAVLEQPNCPDNP